MFDKVLNAPLKWDARKINQCVIIFQWDQKSKIKNSKIEFNAKFLPRIKQFLYFQRIHTSFKSNISRFIDFKK